MDGGSKKRRMDKRDKQLVVVLAICLMVLIATAIGLSSLYVEEPPEVVVETTPTPTPTPTPMPTPTPTPSETPTPEPEPEPEQEPRYDFAALREEYGNDDIVGYLLIEGTTIDYPVTQSGLDDPHYYLTHSIDGSESSAGWIYLHPLNDVTAEDPNTVIYGHNMKKDYMFHSIRYYQSEDYYQEHKYIIYDTEEQMGVWEIFSFYIPNVSFNYINTQFESQEEFYELALEIKSRSLYDTGVEIAPDDRILTLSTCTGANADERFVIGARLITDPEQIPERYRTNDWMSE